MMKTTDAFDKLISEALQGTEKPSPGFTSRVMERTEHVPQRKPVSLRRYVPIAVAACLVVAMITIPMTFRAGSSSTGNAAACNDMAIAESEVEKTRSFATPNSESDKGDSDSSAVNEEIKQSNGVLERVKIPDELVEDVEAYLKENGLYPEDGDVYVLSAGDTALLSKEFPVLSLPEGGCTLEID